MVFNMDKKYSKLEESNESKNYLTWQVSGTATEKLEKWNVRNLLWEALWHSGGKKSLQPGDLVVKWGSIVYTK